MQLYYAEWNWGVKGYIPPNQKRFASDEEAVEYYKGWVGDKLLALYREGNHDHPFVLVYERK
jgi:hypothetical protein